VCDPAEQEQRGRQHRAAVAGGNDGIAEPVANALHGDAQRRIRLLPKCVARMVVHRDDLGRVHDLDVRMVVLRELGFDAAAIADERDRDACLRGANRARDLGHRRPIASHRVDHDAHDALGYSSADFFATICSPPYWPQLMQTRCGTRGAPQFAHACTVGRFSPDFLLHAER
jgi:hypothetical protein